MLRGAKQENLKQDATNRSKITIVLRSFFLKKHHLYNNNVSSLIHGIRKPKLKFV